MKIIKGNIIKLALEDKFDVIAHGCNCFCLQEAGLAAQMNTVFNTNKGTPLWFFDEHSTRRGDINKLGNLGHVVFNIRKTDTGLEPLNSSIFPVDRKGNWVSKTAGVYKGSLTVMNAYTQYNPGKDLSYEALSLCLRKIATEFKGKRIGLPKIGCGIAGGDWNVVKILMKEYFQDCDLTVVEYDNT